MMRRLVVVCCFGLGMIFPAAAQEEYQDTTLIENVSTDALGAVLTHMGKPYTLNDAVDPPMLDIKHTILNANFSLQPVCFSEEDTRTGCPGVNIISIYPGVPLDKINTFNMNSEAIKAQLITSEDGSSFTLMSYYAATDSGITYGTLRGILIRFENAMTRWITEIRSLNIVAPD